MSARARPAALVIGADQVMSCGGTLYHKPPTIDAAREQLLELRERTHSLHAGLAVARDGQSLWRHLGRADLTMREFSESFLDDYVAVEGETLTRSVGAYRIEGARRSALLARRGRPLHHHRAAAGAASRLSARDRLAAGIRSIVEETDVAPDLIRGLIPSCRTATEEVALGPGSGSGRRRL